MVSLLPKKSNGDFWDTLPVALQTWPNRITFLRILGLPILYWLAIEQRRLAFALVFALMGVTDWLDGIIARWTKQETVFGARFDSIADRLFYFSTLIWLYLLEPTIIYDNKAIIGAALFLILGSQIFSFVRYGHFIDFHTWLSKLAGLCVYVFVLSAVLWRFDPWLFMLVAVIVFIATFENILLTAILKSVQQNVRSILFVLFGRKRK